MNIDIHECRCSTKPCKHDGLFVDRQGNNLAGFARLCDTLLNYDMKWDDLVEMVSEEGPTVVRWAFDEYSVI